MLNQEGEMAYPPVRWIQHDADETEALAEDFLHCDELIGSNWSLAYGLADSQLISDLYQRLKQQPNEDSQHKLTVIAVAAFHVLQHNHNSLLPGALETAIQRAITYLSAPSPWLGKDVGLHVVLAHSAHFVLDPEGFAAMQRALSVDHRILVEVTTASA